MNFLAHAYLSFGHPDLLVGNMISDFVKGSRRFDYPLPVQAGITLHRQIDGFTDAHPATKEAARFFKPHYRLYSGAFADVAYDHFLAADILLFPGEELQRFSQWVYTTLEENTQLLPPRFSQLLPYMKGQDWLYNYRSIEGINRSFGGLVRRSAYLTDAEPAIAILQEHYTSLQECYAAFMPSVKTFAKEEAAKLIL